MVSMPGKRSQANLNRKPKSYLFTDALVFTSAHRRVPPKLDFYVFHVFTIAHWPVPPKLDFYVFHVDLGDNLFINNFSKLHSR